MPASVPIAPPPFRLPATGPLWGDALRFAIAPASRGSSLVLSQRTNRGYLYKLIHTNAAQYSWRSASDSYGQRDKRSDGAMGRLQVTCNPAPVYSARFLWRSRRNRIARVTRDHAEAPSLLAGVLYDETGERMSPKDLDQNGKVLDQRKVSGPWDDILPGTVYDRIHTLICH